MTLPRRYRLALRAYPAGYRAQRGAELSATLADGDDERGGPSTREALALAYQGLAARTRLVTSPDGLLVLAATALMAALVGGWSWAERVFLFRGEPAAFLTEAPSLWSQVALGAIALTAVAAGPLGAMDDRRRRTIAVVLAAPLAIAIFTGPGRIVTSGVPDVTTLAEFARWIAEASFHNWGLTLPAIAAAMLSTWAALRALERLDQRARLRALAIGLAILGAVNIAQAWDRPDLRAQYAQSAFADLGPASYVTAVGLALAVAALLRSGDEFRSVRRS
jgi:hypothetical protein